MFWKEVLSHIKEVVGFPIPSSPLVMSLGIKPLMLKAMTHAEWHLILHLLGAARQSIALYWKNPPPPHSHLVSSVVGCLSPRIAYSPH